MIMGLKCRIVQEKNMGCSKGVDNMLINSGEYLATIEQIKQEIRIAQYRAAMRVNTELIVLYYNIGLVIN